MISVPWLIQRSQHGECGHAYPLPSDTYLLGLCSGAFAAAAISACKSLSELLPAAVQIVRVTFRFGLCILDVRNRIEQTDASWSMVVRDLMPGAASEALKEFSQVHVRNRKLTFVSQTNHY
jgi:hypothetical protein